MTRRFKGLFSLLGIWMVGLFFLGCATLETIDEKQGLTQAEQVKCQGPIDRLDEAIEQAGVRDIQAERICGFPYYRVNRFLASFARELSDRQDRTEWLERMRQLGLDGYCVELANLPHQTYGDLFQETDPQALYKRLGQCSLRLMAADLNHPERIRALINSAHVPDDYSAMMRVLGMYPITSWFVMYGVRGLVDQLREDFQRPDAMDRGEIKMYVPKRPRPLLTPEMRADILSRAKSKSALSIPEPDPETLTQLLDFFEPAFKIDTGNDSDQMGRPFWHDAHHIRVDTTDPVVYRFHSFTRMKDQVLLQLNYVIWFPRRPSQGFFDFTGGLLDGLIWRVTLGEKGRVLLYDSIHPCGCFHVYYTVSPLLHPLDEPLTTEPPLIFSQDIPPAEKGRAVVHISSGQHYVVGLSTAAAVTDEAVAYRSDDYKTLRTLPYVNGSRSLFGPDGIVPGTQRAEHWLVWPMGVRSTGAMRQRGRHAMALVGREHFDEARLLERVFELRTQ